jgi:hypothetical protein
MIPENRHHAARVKANRERDRYTGSTSSRNPKIYRTPTPCSCWMCGNPRKWFGLKTIQERRMFQDAQ